MMPKLDDIVSPGVGGCIYAGDVQTHSMACIHLIRTGDGGSAAALREGGHGFRAGPKGRNHLRPGSGKRSHGAVVEVRWHVVPLAVGG